MENTDSENSTLLKMPDDVMRIILETLDYCGIQSLRKTCHNLRDFIDVIKPDPNTVTLKVVVFSNYIRLNFKFSNSEDYLCVEYEKEENGCSVKKSTELTTKNCLLENQNFLDVFINDFRIFMKFSESQKVPLNLMNFLIQDRGCSEFFDKIQTIESHLKVKTLTMTVFNETEVARILNLTSSGVLKTIQIDNSTWEKYILQMSEISRMEQWRQAEKVTLFRFDVWDPRDFLHFRNVDASFIDLSPEDAVLLKETFLKSPNFESFKFRYSRLEDGVFDAIGPNPITIEGDEDEPERSWYFENPENPDKVLLVESTEWDNLMSYSSVMSRSGVEKMLEGLCLF